MSPSRKWTRKLKKRSTRLYGRIFRERFVTKNSYQPSIRIIVPCSAFKSALNGMVRSVHGTNPLISMAPTNFSSIICFLSTRHCADVNQGRNNQRNSFFHFFTQNYYFCHKHGLNTLLTNICGYIELSLSLPHNFSNCLGK